MEVRPYVPDDFLAIRLQPAQVHAWGHLQNLQTACSLATSQECFTALVDGEVIACVGLITFWEGRRHVWAYLSRDAGPHLVALTWQVRRWLRYHGQGRIEAAIDPEFHASVRWARRLGFSREGRMAQYVPGKDYDLYARIGR